MKERLESDLIHLIIKHDWIAALNTAIEHFALNFNKSPTPPNVSFTSFNQVGYQLQIHS